MAPNSAQWNFFVADMAAVNRTKTPFVVVQVHRLMYAAAASSNVSFPIDARTARAVNAGTAVRATLRITQGTTSRSVTVTLRRLSASARSRLLSQGRN